MFRWLFGPRYTFDIDPSLYDWAEVDNDLWVQGLISLYREGDVFYVALVSQGVEHPVYPNSRDLGEDFLDEVQERYDQLQELIPTYDESSWYGRTQACVHPTEGIGPAEEHAIKEMFK